MRSLSLLRTFPIQHRPGGGFINTIRLASKVSGKTRPYNHNYLEGKLHLHGCGID